MKRNLILLLESQLIVSCTGPIDRWMSAQRNSWMICKLSRNLDCSKGQSRKWFCRNSWTQALKWKSWSPKDRSHWWLRRVLWDKTELYSDTWSYIWVRGGRRWWNLRLNHTATHAIFGQTGPQANHPWNFRACQKLGVTPKKDCIRLSRFVFYPLFRSSFWSRRRSSR